jgi:hypothetical protein
MDLLYLGIAGFFFVLTWLLMRMCERLDRSQPGGQQ